MAPRGVDTPAWVQLTSAAAQWVADAAGIRVLHVKGPAAAHVLGLRRESSDVDVLVHPADWLPYLRALERAGFITHGEEVPTSGHSVDVISPEWSASVDVHHKFPGIERDAGEAFDILWEHHSPVDLAGIRCHTLPKVPHALIIGLHAARSPEGTVKWSEADAAWKGLDETERSHLVDLVHELGAAPALGVRFEEFSQYSTEEVRRLWAARARRDAEAVWWMRAIHRKSLRGSLLFLGHGASRYFRALRFRHRGDVRGALGEVVRKGRRWTLVGGAELRRALSKRLGRRPFGRGA